MKTAIPLLSALLLLASHANAWCWDEASARFGIHVDLLKATAKQESGMNPKAINVNANGTEDMGLMQINSGWLPQLKAFGIERNDLFDACTSIQIGAWIMAQNMNRYGATWNAVGAYNVGCAKLSVAECQKRRSNYAWKIFRRLNRQQQEGINRAF